MIPPVLVPLDQMLAAHDEELLTTMRLMELQLIYLPNPDYLQYQPHLDALMRATLFDWMLEVRDCV